MVHPLGGPSIGLVHVILLMGRLLLLGEMDLTDLTSGVTAVGVVSALLTALERNEGVFGLLSIV